MLLQVLVLSACLIGNTLSRNLPEGKLVHIIYISYERKEITRISHSTLRRIFLICRILWCASGKYKLFARKIFGLHHCALHKGLLFCSKPMSCVSSFVSAPDRAFAVFRNTHNANLRVLCKYVICIRNQQ